MFGGFGAVDAVVVMRLVVSSIAVRAAAPSRSASAIGESFGTFGLQP